MAVRLIEHIGEPPWAELEGQASCKYASVAHARELATPWVMALLDKMLALDPGGYKHTVVDIKHWSHMPVDFWPAMPGWHIDCVPVMGHPQRHETHVLYQCGAGCPTVFRVDEEIIRPREGDLTLFNRDYHQAVPATRAGPRFLMRVSWCDNVPGSRQAFTPTLRKYPGAPHV